MTTLNIGLALNIPATLENRIIHEYNNGGIKSSYGLSNYQRSVLIKYLFSQNPKCFCVKCLQGVISDYSNLHCKGYHALNVSTPCYNNGTYCQRII